MRFFSIIYLCYREGEPRHLYGAVVAAAAAFYSYSPARIVMLAAGLLMFLGDIRYHWQQRAHVLRAFGLALILALPFARFLYNHPDASAWQMRLLGSVWVTDVSFWVKLKTTLGEYLHGLDPLYWYLPHTSDLPRHTMSGYGHLLRPTLPFGLFGIGLAVKNFRQPAWRTLLIAVAAAPAGAALVRLGITRALFMVVPMASVICPGDGHSPGLAATPHASPHESPVCRDFSPPGGWKSLHVRRRTCTRPAVVAQLQPGRDAVRRAPGFWRD